MQLSDIRDWLKAVFREAEYYYIGRLDSSHEKAIGIYDGELRPDIRCLGPKTYQEKAVSILVHWNQNARETEDAAMRLYSLLRDTHCPVIGGYMVPFISLRHTAPQDCTENGSGTYDRVIEAVFYYNL